MAQWIKVLVMYTWQPEFRSQSAGPKVGRGSQCSCDKMGGRDKGTDLHRSSGPQKVAPIQKQGSP